MIKFFRKIRQNLIMENKTSKYFKYAIGEIVLVVIGILIALQINNWNETRKINNIEQSLLNDLKTEVKSNVSDLQIIIDSHRESLNAASRLSSFIFEPEKAINVSYPVLEKLFNSMQYNMTYDPKLGTLKSIINSGKIDYISNKKLKYQLSSLTDLIIDANEETNLIQKNMSILFYPSVNKLFERQPDNSMVYNVEKLKYDSEYIYWLGYLKVMREIGLEEESGLLNNLQNIIEIIDSEIKQ